MALMVLEELRNLQFKPLRRHACRLSYLRSAHETLTGLFQQLLLPNGGGHWLCLCFKDWVLLLRLLGGGGYTAVFRHGSDQKLQTP